jgi:hypothetical protein
VIFSESPSRDPPGYVVCRAQTTAPTQSKMSTASEQAITASDKTSQSQKKRKSAATSTPVEGRGSGKRPLTSHIFLNGTKFEQNGDDWWRCNLCKAPVVREYKVTGCSTDKAAQHLRKEHQIGKAGEIEKVQQEDKGLSLPVFKSVLCSWIVGAHLSFHHVEHPKFLELLKTMNPRAESLLPCANTIRVWIEEVFEKQQQSVMGSLQQSSFRIHWSFDLWTSPNNKAILGIVAHWLDSSTSLRPGKFELHGGRPIGCNGVFLEVIVMAFFRD